MTSLHTSLHALINFCYLTDRLQNILISSQFYAYLGNPGLVQFISTLLAFLMYLWFPAAQLVTGWSKVISLKCWWLVLLIGATCHC